MNRRNTADAVLADVAGVKVPTWYHSPAQIEEISKNSFVVKKLVPIGLFIPPSYLQSFFNNKNWALRLLSFLDKFRLPQFANFSDHYFIHLQKKTP
jgi:hypothetical protein